MIPSPKYRLPVPQGPDDAKMPYYAGEFISALETVLDTKAGAPPANTSYLTYGPNQSHNACTVWGSATDNIQFQWNVGTDAPHAHLRFHVASGTSGHYYTDLMRNDGHAVNIPNINWASLPSVPSYVIAQQGNDLVVTPQTGSSRRIKKDIVEAAPELPDVHPVRFAYRHDEDATHIHHTDRDRTRLGFIAEDVPLDAQILDSDGNAMDVDARSMCAYLWAEVLRLRDRLDALEGEAA